MFNIIVKDNYQKWDCSPGRSRRKARNRCCCDLQPLAEADEGRCQSPHSPSLMPRNAGFVGGEGGGGLSKRADHRW